MKAIAILRINLQFGIHLFRSYLLKCFFEMHEVDLRNISSFKLPFLLAIEVRYNHIIPHHIISCHIMSYTLSYHIILYHIMSYHVISDHIMSNHIIYFIISYHIMSHYAISDHVTSHHISYIIYHITNDSCNKLE